MTRTAKQRIEQAVKKVSTADSRELFGMPVVPKSMAILMILAERARLRRGVNEKRKITVSMCGTSEFCKGYRAACDDILKLMEG